MRTEVLVLRRCCFCIPVRHGLLTWGYFNLAISSMWLVLVFFEFFHGLRSSFCYYYIADLMFVLLSIPISVMNVVCTFLLIVASHKKSARLLKMYYRWEMLLTAFWTLLFLCEIINDIIVLLEYDEIFGGFFNLFFYVALNYLFTVVVICCNFYILIIVRSKIFSLESKHEFRFVNHTIEAQCHFYDVDLKEREDK